MRVRIVFFKEDMTDEFFELLSTKEPQETLQNKETTVQNYRKMSNQYTKETPPPSEHTYFMNEQISILQYFGKHNVSNIG